jgi:molybdopterin converting factor small subunit
VLIAADLALVFEMPMTSVIPEVRVEIPRELRSLCGGQSQLCVVARDVHGLLAEIARQHPQVHVSICDERGEPRPHINVFVNDQFVARSELDISLAAGDQVTILPAVSGG